MINFYVGKDAKSVNVHLKLSIRVGVNNNRVMQSNETGASGSLRIRQTAYKEAGKVKENNLL